MKILFIYGAFENLGIEYLSAVLKKHGHETKLAFTPRLFNDPFLKIKYLGKFFSYEKYLLREVLEYQPDLIAFSLISADYLWGVKLAQKIKEQLTSTHITVGGIHPTSTPETVLANQAIDSVIRGEGEYALLDLVECLKKGSDFAGVKNICLKRDKQIIKNELRPYIENLDELPFPDKELYYRILPQYKSGYTLITRRGCVNHCSYCHNCVWQSLYPAQAKIRLRSVGNVLAELKEALGKYNFKRVRVNDDLFTYNEEWLKEFSGLYAKEINRPLFCFGSPSTINRRVIEYLKQLKCYQLCIGVQSTSSVLREKVLARKENNEKIAEAIAWCKEYKIRCVIDNIIGLPLEREEDLLTMARFYNQNRPNRICVFKLIYFPGTPITELAFKEKILNKEQLKAILESPEAVANTLQNRLQDREKIRYHWLLLLFFLPPALYNWIIEKKMYRFFPIGLSPSIVEAVFTVFAKDRLDVPRIRYYQRYRHFIKKILYFKINNI